MTGGPYLRYKACKFTSRAVLRYRAESRSSSSDFPCKLSSVSPLREWKTKVHCVKSVCSGMRWPPSLGIDPLVPNPSVLVLPVEEVLHVLGHDLGDVLQIFVQLCQVGLCPSILVHALCVLHKRVCWSIRFPNQLLLLSVIVIISDIVQLTWKQSIVSSNSFVLIAISKQTAKQQIENRGSQINLPNRAKA